MAGDAKRFNDGKTRHDLVPAYAQEQYARVLTKGADKYGDNNWQKGMPWNKVLASLERHLQAIKAGEDFDPETGEYHSAHLMCNAAFLTEYYRIYPQGDNRPHMYLNTRKIGLDIDEVLCDWITGWCERNTYKLPNWYRFSYDSRDKFTEMITTGEDIAFLETLLPKIDPISIPFEPHCYITARDERLREVTQKWLITHGFPAVPLYTVGHGVSKLDACKQAGIDIFVDDNYEHFVELTNGGICCYLMDATHNQRFDVGHKRIYSLSDLV